MLYLADHKRPHSHRSVRLCQYNPQGPKYYAVGPFCRIHLRIPRHYGGKSSAHFCSKLISIARYKLTTIVRVPFKDMASAPEEILLVICFKLQVASPDLLA